MKEIDMANERHSLETDNSAIDRAVLGDLVRDWVETGWRHSKDEPFSFRGRLSQFYDWAAPNAQLFDDFDEQRRVNSSVSDYAEIWDKFIPTMISLSNSLEGFPDIIVSGDIAVMSVRFVTHFMTADGKSDVARTFSSLVWRRDESSWRIIREHGSALAR